MGTRRYCSVRKVATVSLLYSNRTICFTLANPSVVPPAERLTIQFANAYVNKLYQLPLEFF